jgi:hypothetical protein
VGAGHHEGRPATGGAAGRGLMGVKGEREDAA